MDIFDFTHCITVLLYYLYIIYICSLLIISCVRAYRQAKPIRSILYPIDHSLYVSLNIERDGSAGQATITYVIVKSTSTDTFSAEDLLHELFGK